MRFKQSTKFTYDLEMDEEDGMGWLDERYSNNWPSSRTSWKWMKSMVWDDQIRDIQTTYQVHIPSEDGWRGWDGMIRREIFKQLTKFTHILDDRWRGWDRMIRWEIFKQLTKFTYNLEIDEKDGMGWSEERYSNNWLSSHTIWRQTKRTGWDDQMRDIQTIEQVHIPPGDGWRGWDGMIRWEIFKQLTKFTYILETNEEDRMGWSDERYSNNWTSSHTSWRWMKRMGWDDQEIFKQLTKFTYILDDGWRGRDRMIQWEIFKQSTKFTYNLETDEEDRMGWAYGRYSNNWPSSLTGWRWMKRMGWDDQMRDIQTIGQVHLRAGDRWRGWDGMIAWEIFKPLTKFTYSLEMDDEDGMG